MATPKISVLIPLYNRKQYAADCIKSVLNQTFQDFEIVIRDDCSTDGVFEFVKENFTDSRIRFLQNEKNSGEFVTRNALTVDAKGKYVAILHNDDLHLPDALEHLYGLAEKFNADVVHASSFLISDEYGLMNKSSQPRKFSYEPRPVTEIELVPNDPAVRFNHWFTGKTFRDDQYNLFRRQFVLDAKVFSSTIGWDSLIVSLMWIMRAKVLVKTPKIFYIRRENTSSQTYDNITIAHYSSSKFENEISRRIELFRNLEKLINDFEFFRNSPVRQYQIKARAFGLYESLDFNNPKFYGRKELAAAYNTVEKVFKEYFGDDAIYLAMMYHWAHSMHFNQNQFQGALQNCLKILDRNI